MDWNDTLTLIILADTILNAKLLVGGYFAWRWWQRRKRPEGEPLLSSRPNDTMLPIVAHWEGAVTWIGYGEKEAE